MRVSIKVTIKGVEVPVLISSIGIKEDTFNDYFTLIFDTRRSNYEDGYVTAIGQYGDVEEEVIQLPDWFRHIIASEGLITTAPSWYEIPSEDMCYSYNEYTEEDDNEDYTVDTTCYGHDETALELWKSARKGAVESFTNFKRKCYITTISFDVDKDYCYDNDIDPADFSKEVLADSKLETVNISLGTWEFSPKIPNNVQIEIN